MPIVSTEILGAGRWSDGIHLRVKLTDHVGKERVIARTVPNDTDIEAFIAAKVVRTNKSSITTELRRAVYDEPWDYELQYATLAQLRDYIRNEYSGKEKSDLIPLARRIIEWIENGRFTVAQFRTAFNMSNPQFNAFRTRLEALRDCDELIKNVELLTELLDFEFVYPPPPMKELQDRLREVLTVFDE